MSESRSTLWLKLRTDQKAGRAQTHCTDKDPAVQGFLLPVGSTACASVHGRGYRHFLAAVSLPSLKGAATANFLVAVSVPSPKGSATATFLAASSVPGPRARARPRPGPGQGQATARPGPGYGPGHGQGQARARQRPGQGQGEQPRRSQGALLGAARATPKCRQCNVKNDTDQ